VDPLCPIGHLREAYPKGAPKYDIEIIYADSVSIVVGFGGDSARSVRFERGRERSPVEEILIILIFVFDAKRRILKLAHKGR
jgi:hypothetical protein